MTDKHITGNACDGDLKCCCDILLQGKSGEL